MLTEKQVALLKEELSTSKNPLFFYDSDGDGLASFLLLYRIHREGKGYRLATTSILDESFLRQVNEYDPDKIFILDIPVVKQEFVDGAKRPVFWIDHHPLVSLKNINYFNPHQHDPLAYVPTSLLAYQVNQRPEDLWIASVGCLADWCIPPFLDDFIARYPSLLSKKAPLHIINYKEPVGKLVKLFFFIQKGPSSEVSRSIKVLSRIESPLEIIEQSTPQGRFLWRHFEKVNKKYEELLSEAKKNITSSPLLLYYYTDNRWSFTANLSNELAASYPQKVILIARRNADKVKCSLRGKNISSALEKALVGINGTGGGHPEACGAVISSSDWERFLSNLKEEIKSLRAKKKK
jgi:single-stranded DNA-specific DHH superfamily exonuclease